MHSNAHSAQTQLNSTDHPQVVLKVPPALLSNSQFAFWICPQLYTLLLFQAENSEFQLL